MARIETRERMVRLIGQWRASAQTKAEFIRAHGISRGKFEYWQRRLAVRGLRQRRHSLNLIPVQVSGGAVEDPPYSIEIVLTSGERLRVQAKVPIEALREVVNVLRQGC